MKLWVVFAALLLVSTCGDAQQPAAGDATASEAGQSTGNLPSTGNSVSVPANPTGGGTLPTVKFILDWPQGRPWTNFSITVRSDGKSHFEGTPSTADGGDSSADQQDFTISEANRAKIFEVAKNLNYFNGDFETHLKHIAQTGNKTLEYSSPQAHGSASYNFSQDAGIQQLTHLFWSIATTFDYKRKLEFQYRFDKLGMDSRLKELVDLDAAHNVEELANLEPILRKIANDSGMMHISRQSAQQLLRSIHPPPANADQGTAER